MPAAALTSSDQGSLGAVASFELVELVDRMNALERRAHKPEKWDRWNIRTFLKGMGIPVRGEPGCKKYVLFTDLKRAEVLDSILDAETFAELDED